MPTVHAVATSSSSDDADLASSDEMKVFKDEGEEAEERRSSADGGDDDPIDVMNDLKRDLIDEGEKHTTTIHHEPPSTSGLRSPCSPFPSSSSSTHHIHPASSNPLGYFPFHHPVNGSFPSMDKMASAFGSGPSPFSAFMKYQMEDYRQPPPAHMGTIGQKPEIQRPMFPASHQYSPFWMNYQMNPFSAQLPAYGPLRPFPFTGSLHLMSHLNHHYPPHHPHLPSLSPSQPNGNHPPLESERMMTSAASEHQKSSPHSSSLSRMSNGTSSASSVGANSPSSSALSAGRSISSSISSGSESKSKLGHNGHHQLISNHHLNNLSSSNNNNNNRLNHLNQNSNSSPSGHHNISSNNNLRNIDDDSRSVSSNNSNNMSHVKKPLNAFMLYMKEQRPKVVSEYTLKESAAINQILGKQWHNLSREEQQKYYEMARKERQRHQQLYPGWTARDNYAIHQRKKKKKRDKSADGEGGSLKKCRARFGLDQQSKWCKPCRRKKKCARFMEGNERGGGGSERDNLGSVGSTEAATPDSKSANDSDGDNLNLSPNELSLSSPPVPTHGDHHLVLPLHSSTINGHHHTMSHHQRLLQVHHHHPDYPSSRNNSNLLTSSSSSSLSCPPRNSPIGPNNPLSIEQLTRPHRPTLLQSS